MIDPSPTRIAKSAAAFFQLSLAEVRRLVAEGGGHYEMTTYIVLCSAVNVRGGVRYCTHGAKSVQHRTGISYRMARKAIDWLLLKNFMRLPSPDDLSYLGKGQTRATRVEYVILGSDDLDVAVSRHFVEGHGKDSGETPIGQLFEQVSGDDDISRAQAVLDAFLLYFGLMREQDFGACAGVDPDVWHRTFEQVDDDYSGQATPDIPGSKDSVLVTIKEADDYTKAYHRADLLGCDQSDEHGRIRFWHAIGELRRWRLIYTALVMWDGDPLDAQSGRKCEPLATLYVADRWAREFDTHLQTAVHKACWRAEARDRGSDFAAAGEPPPFVGTGTYRYIVRARDVSRVKVIGQLRVRYWAATASTSAGRKREADKTAKCLRDLEAMIL